MNNFVGTVIESRAMRRLARKAGVLPKRGVHHGGGRHVPMPQRWDGIGKIRIGWSDMRVQRHANGTSARVSLTPGLRVRLNNGVGLNQADRDEWAALRLKLRTTVPGDWEDE